MSTNDQIHQQWREGAAAFHEANSQEKDVVLAPAIAREMRLLIEAKALDFGDPVLDFGCGDGKLTRSVARLGFRTVHAFDALPEMCALARRACEGSGADVTVEGRLDAFGGVSYGLVMQNFVQHCMKTEEETHRILTDARRVLRGGGHLLITLAHPEYLDKKHSSKECEFEGGRYPKDGELYRVTLFERGSTFSFLDYYWTIETMATSLGAAGFELVKTVDVMDLPAADRPASGYPSYAILVARTVE